MRDPHGPPERVKSDAELEVIHRLRGRILSNVNAVEDRVDVVLCLYFNQMEDHDTSERFRSWVLRRLSFETKLDLLKQVVDDLGVQDHLALLLANLRRASALRNKLAHSNITQNDMGPHWSKRNWDDLWRWYTARRSRVSLEMIPVDIVELEADDDFVSRLFDDLLLLQSAAEARSQGVDPSVALEELAALIARDR